MASGPALLETAIPGLVKRRGKVRDIYELGVDRLLIVATDRISAFDWVLPNGIPDKGRVLTEITEFWFHRILALNHKISTDIDAAGLDLDPELRASLTGRSMVVKKATVIPFECVVRGCLSGSGWREYQASGSVCGIRLPKGLEESERITPPIFTPATKADSGHDENVSFEAMVEKLGAETAELLKEQSLSVYRQAANYAESRGLILADTKFEWGWDVASGGLMLIDEILTPDSSRYWPEAGYQAGRPQPSFDKQFVRDWLESTGWDKASPPPALPADIVAKTREKYIEAYEILTDWKFPWT